MILCDNEQNQFCTKIDSTFFLTIWRLIGDRSPVRKTGRKGRFLAPGSLGNIQSLSVRKTGRISLITYWTNHMVDHMEYVLQYSYQALKISDSYKIIRSFHKLSFFIINVNNRTSKRVSRKKVSFFSWKILEKKTVWYESVIIPKKNYSMIDFRVFLTCTGGAGRFTDCWYSHSRSKVEAADFGMNLLGS